LNTEALLRDPQPGDMGWVVMQHGEIYAREYAFSGQFESMVAEIASRYLKNFQPGRERGWIAELEGQRAGAAFVVRRSATAAQLRLLIVTPQARGLGLGARLTDECIAFARDSGYRKLVLWTHEHLDAARAIYRSRGFRRTKGEPVHAYGQDLVSEKWELGL
jgi:GNAT superfamily N-acetyltransferase